MLLAGLLALPLGVAAKGKPTPVGCPDDVAATLGDTCPCAGKMQPDGSTLAYKNHGQYVSCVVRLRNQLRKAGCPKEALQTVARCAARSTCGKEEAVVCCFSTTGTCDDPTPGNATPEGVCSNDAEHACDTAADCTTSRARLAHDEAACAEAGGTSAGSGSVCTACTTSTTSTSTSSTTTTTL
jgi:hypothetical protein